jgi:pilus assembly protein CpaB
MVLVLSLICGVSAAVGVNLVLGRKAQVEAAPRTTPILVAAVDIARGAPLKPELVTTRDWPEGLVPNGAVRDVEEIVDRAAIGALFAGEPILASKISDSGLGVAGLVQFGMRAFTIQTPTEQSGVAGFILPGNHVDVLLTITARDEEDVSGGGTTTTLLQNVEILAAGKQLDQTDTKDGRQQMRSVTLLVTPEMAAKLTLASSMGSLTLTLRNDTDTSIADTRPITMNELRFLQEALLAENPSDEDAEDTVNEMAEAVAAAPPPCFIKCLRGNSSSLIQIAEQ